MIGLCCSTWCENLEDIQRVFMNYGKGMGPAVQEGDIDSIRIAINFCCRTDISMDGMTLLDIAFENSDENIIRLITRVTPYLVSIAFFFFNVLFQGLYTNKHLKVFT